MTQTRRAVWSSRSGETAIPLLCGSAGLQAVRPLFPCFTIGCPDGIRSAADGIL